MPESIAFSKFMKIGVNFMRKVFPLIHVNVEPEVGKYTSSKLLIFSAVLEGQRFFCPTLGQAPGSILQEYKPVIYIPSFCPLHTC